MSSLRDKIHDMEREEAKAKSAQPTCERCGKPQSGVHTCTPSADYLRKCEAVYRAAKELVAQKGRFNTEQAYRKLEEALK